MGGGKKPRTDTRARTDKQTNGRTDNTHKAKPIHSLYAGCNQRRPDCKSLEVRHPICCTTMHILLHKNDLQQGPTDTGKMIGKLTK